MNDSITLKGIYSSALVFEVKVWKRRKIFWTKK